MLQFKNSRAGVVYAIAGSFRQFDYDLSALFAWWYFILVLQIYNKNGITCKYKKITTTEILQDKIDKDKHHHQHAAVHCWTCASHNEGYFTTS